MLGNVFLFIVVNNELCLWIVVFIFFDFVNNKIVSIKDGIIGVYNGGGLKMILWKVCCFNCFN